MNEHVQRGKTAGALARRLLLAAGLFSVGAAWAVVETTPITSNQNVTIPPGVTSVTVEAWGGGGGGGAGAGTNGNSRRGGGGGGGGQYSRGTIDVMPGQSYPAVVGAGGGSSADGGDSTFSVTIGSVTSRVLAKGGSRGGNATAGNTNNGSGGSNGAGGSGGSGNNNTGSVRDSFYPSGGSGATGTSNTAGGGGGGGGGAGTNNDGTTATSATGGNGGASLGGKGGNGRTGSAGVGSNGDSYSGGGGGGHGVNGGGSGANGWMQITWERPPVVNAIEIASTNPTGANTTVEWVVTFSDSVTGVDAGDFELVGQPAENNPHILSVSGSGKSYTVRANTGSGTSGTLGLNLKDNGSIKDTSTATTALAGAIQADGSFVGQTYQLLPPVPTLSKETSAQAGVVGDVVTFEIKAENTFATSIKDMEVTDILPAGMRYAGHSVGYGDSVEVTGQTVSWKVPSLAPGNTARLTLSVELMQKGFWTNTITAPGALAASASLLVLPSAITHFRFDEKAGSYNGSGGEAKDSGGTELHGHRWKFSSGASNMNVVTPSPMIAAAPPAGVTISGGFCNAASFDGTAVIQVEDSPRFDYKKHLSASAWVYPTSRNASGEDDANASILSNDTNYEFHLTKDGRVYWWWQDTDNNNAQVTLFSNATIPLNRWTHVAITMNADKASNNAIIYINGKANAQRTWKGTLRENHCPFYIGGDIHTTATCESPVSGRSFKGMIDEVKLYAYELSAAEVEQDMKLGRSCSGTFDHLRIEHGGVGSTCGHETVTIKACLDAACSRLYTGRVLAQLTPTEASWVGTTALDFSGGMTSRVVSSSTTVTLALGALNVVPEPSAGVRCFNGSAGTASCDLKFETMSCAFGGSEVGGTPSSRIFTKLAGRSFNLDLMALSSPHTINTAYVGEVKVDLVDSTTSACPTGNGLTAEQTVKFTAADKGRKTVTFSYPNAARNVRMRAKSDPPACSSDNFAIRPTKFVVSSSMNNQNLTGTPVAIAGSAFTLTATGKNDDGKDVASGYDGTPEDVDDSQVTDHKGVAIASGVLTGHFATGTGKAASGDNFRYRDVGSIKLKQDAVKDKGSSVRDKGGFTWVDWKEGDCVVGSASNTLSGLKYGCDIGSDPVTFGRWRPSHFSFKGTLLPGCVPGGFTYMGDDKLLTSLVVTAHAASFENDGSTSAAPIKTSSADDPKVSRYDTDGLAEAGKLAKIKIEGRNGSSTDDLAARVSDRSNPLAPITVNEKAAQTEWVDGRYKIAENTLFAFSRPDSPPDGPFDQFKLLASLEEADPDGAALIDPKETNPTRILYGRLHIPNAYGSELLKLPLSIEAQYWTGQYFMVNPLDSCTTITPKNADLQNPKDNLDLGETGFVGHDVPITLNGGRGQAVLTPPGVGNSGSVEWGPGNSGSVQLNPGEVPGFGKVAPGTATFGVSKTPLIYRRERY